MKLEIKFTPKQSLFDRMINQFPYTLYGGAKGGGKSHGLRLILLKRRFEMPGSVCYLFRKTFPELQRNHITPLFKQFPDLRPYYNESKKQLLLPNGSEFNFAYVEHRKDLEKFQGLDAHDLAIEEAGEWPFEHFEYLDTQKRSAKAGIKPRTILTGNPGGIGHSWLKRLFVSKEYRGSEKASNYCFIKALVEDNPFIMKNDPEYVLRLESMRNEVLRRAFRFGDWDVKAGQFFSELQREVHVIPAFKIPQHWKWFGSYDYGYNHCASWGFWVTDEDGQVYRVNEIVQSGLRIDQQANAVKEFLREVVKRKEKKDESILFWAGRDCWATKKGGDPTIAEDFARHGIFLKPANIDRKQGASQVRMYLSHTKDETGKRIGPRFKFFDNCKIGFDCLSRMTHNPDDIEDVLKIDSVDGDPYTGDDTYDEIRYGLMSRPAISIAPKKWRGTVYDDYDDEKTTSWQTV
jgi:phage terminase large subunit